MLMRSLAQLNDVNFEGLAMKARDDLDEMLAVDVLSDPLVLDGLSHHQRQVAAAWLKQCNDRRGIPDWPHNKRR